MNIKNCPICKKIFSPVCGSLICKDCIRAEEENFIKVRDYLRENRGTDINIVAEETGVSTKKILKYLREGRLEVSDGMGDFLKCEKCGISIRSGQYCRSCLEKVSKDLSSLLKKESNDTQSSGVRMHIRKK